MESFPSIQCIYNLVCQEEKQREISIRTTPTIDSTALQASKPLSQPSEKRQHPYINIVTSMLTPEQYNKLIAILVKEEPDGSSAHLAGTTLTCLSSVGLSIQVDGAAASTKAEESIEVPPPKSWKKKKKQKLLSGNAEKDQIASPIGEETDDHDHATFEDEDEAEAGQEGDELDDD
ncbi:hypothetical protein JRO89_XS13G0265600 [Xanthoceras sorbifolium]|uniref:Uncharacterized protein n=1 Tax=Xanthoceras sorbifolium TaxID=99658 RepID=A0ABQ8HA13_9ROSI|nr:hypothetical protein JRO89_XS13G0265600 [Xanthoceras sorbifolium]